MMVATAYTPTVDIWALGVMLYAMLHGAFPFYETSLPLLFQRILAGRYPTPTEGSASAHDLIRRLLEPVPTYTHILALSPPSPAAIVYLGSGKYRIPTSASPSPKSASIPSGQPTSPSGDAFCMLAAACF